MNTALVSVGGHTYQGGEYMPLRHIVADLPPFVPDPRLHGPAAHRAGIGVCYLAARGPLVGGWTVVRLTWHEDERRWIGPMVTGEGLTCAEADAVACRLAQEEVAVDAVK